MTTKPAPSAFLANVLQNALARDAQLPFWRLARLALFQVSCGMVAVMLTGTLNRVMIVEFGMPGWVVALMVALPLVAAPFRALIGYKSDTHRSVFGWRRLPYVWFGSLLQFGGLAIMPFALLVLSGDSVGPAWPGFIGAALGFLMIGAGMHTVQTAGLALATDLATEDNRARVVAFHYVMLLIGMMLSGLVFSTLLIDFTPLTLIQVIQGAAVLAFALNIYAMWGQETRSRPGQATPVDDDAEGFRLAWRAFITGGSARRLLVGSALGAAGFNMADVVIEPYGGQVLGLSVGATTLLTAIWAMGTLIGFLLAWRALARGGEALRVAGAGVVLGLPAFALVMLSAPLHSANLYGLGAFLIGAGGGMFGVGTLSAVMALAREGYSGLAIGAWGAVQATAAGVAIAFAGVARDMIAHAAAHGGFGAVVYATADAHATGYLSIYAIEILLLFATLIVIGPLAKFRLDPTTAGAFALPELPPSSPAYGKARP